ncbi:type IV pilus inner membrane component PilO [Methylomonas albis]|uniref:Type 4a pilus biogenesis protein PilO n=1 Tax=Methylomonas albis TaxID=1854563 RepID=A0ABR9CUP2_9GAMM|nr:type 4a pilus biogenesis protein PilO [Methylomonas albis]MBD9354499.1 type 4a pilus biogenesis protein PilO [Methylomonas albis]
MNLSEINWDINSAGSWPTPLKIIVILIFSALTAAAGVYFVTVPQLDELDVLEKQEESLKSAFEVKQKKAVNLQDYRDQLDQIEASLGEMLKQMPTKAEVASLLVDISQTGLASGLEFKLFQPSVEISREFYSELPIGIQVVGKYEELGLFVSGLASLPRIVTVHDVVMTPMGKEGKDGMSMSATIKTYNEGEAAQAAAGPAAKKRRGQ